MFRYCLNTGTISGQKLSLVDELKTASKAGFDSVEPWMREIHEYRKANGSLKPLREYIAELGLSVESAIGFGKWAVEDDTERRAGLDEVRRDMEALAELGGKRLACPPVGATDKPIDLSRFQERYEAVLKLGDEFGVQPLLELWGFSANLSKIEDVLKIAATAAHPKAAVLLDVYHIYKGGGNYEAMRLLSQQALPVLHLNDFPANPPRETIKDADRVFPGDGIAPLDKILQMVDCNGGTILSLELFNRNYWAMPALEACRAGLMKSVAAVAHALSK